MYICLLGDFASRPDEGMKNVSKKMRDSLSFKNDILALNNRHIFRKAFLRNIRSFHPEIIHYLHGPTIRSLIILRVAKRFSGNGTKTIVTATRPYFSRYSKWAVSLLKPDLVLTQSARFEDFFRKRGCLVQFFPNGVDCQEFCPVSDSEKINIRQKLNLSLEKKIVLHVGHFKANRNLEIFKEIQKIDNLQVVIVGGVTETSNETLKKDLKRSGIKCFHKFYEDISRFYKMADLYVFPLKDTGDKFPGSYNQVGAIDMPLSVLEAMACNLPVISTEFGALPRILETGDGLTFCRTNEDILNAVKRACIGVPANTRQKVLPFQWGRVIEQLETIYQSVLVSDSI
jgi:glycosyltransferase involved in cell wall biosynthesis